MLDLADRMLAVLGAILIVLANELRLFNARPRLEEGGYVHETIMRGAQNTDLVYLSTPDLWLRGGLVVMAAAVAIWALSASLRETARR